MAGACPRIAVDDGGIAVDPGDASAPSDAGGPPDPDDASSGPDAAAVDAGPPYLECVFPDAGAPTPVDAGFADFIDAGVAFGDGGSSFVDAGPGPCDVDAGPFAPCVGTVCPHNVDAFAGCTEIEGDVWFLGPAATSLSLPSLVVLHGRLFVSRATNLSTFSLPGLTTIEDDVTLFETPLSDLGGLAALTTVQGTLSIQGASQLTSLAALANLTSACAVVIDENEQLVDLSGLEGLSGLSGCGAAFGVRIRDNPGLASVHGLENVTTLAGLVAHGNPSLTSLAALESLTSIGYVSLRDNPQLASLAFLSGVTITPGASILVIGNTALTSLEGLEGATILDTFAIEEQPEVRSLAPVANVTRVDDLISIHHNRNLPTCEVDAFVERAGSTPFPPMLGNNSCACPSPP